MGAGDHHCHEGQEAICCQRPRDKHDRVIVTEKLDGSNVSIARIGGRIIALGRSGYPAETSKYTQHRVFAEWVSGNEPRFLRALSDGQRIVGEWLAQAHGTRYQILSDPFVAFDLMEAMARMPHDHLRSSAAAIGLECASVLHDGASISVDAVAPMLAQSRHGALDPVEGAVWRVERRGKFDFIAKWVRSDKVDGYLLPEISGQPPVWNWMP